MVEESLAENVQNLQFLSIKKVGTLFDMSFYLEVLFFLCGRNFFYSIQTIFLNNCYTFEKHFLGIK